jgi:hypothetical protein
MKRTICYNKKVLNGSTQEEVMPSTLLSGCLVAVTPPEVEESASASFDKRLKLGQSELREMISLTLERRET